MAGIMWMSLTLIVLFTTGTQSLISQYREEYVCNEVHTKTGYGTPSGLPITCCKFQSFNTGSFMEKYWNDCAVPKEGERINATLWRVYDCIVKKHLNGKPLNFTNFADIMSSDFSPAIREEIIRKTEQIASTCNETALSEDTEYGLLKNIWKKYYHLQIEICSSNSEADLNLTKQFPSAGVEAVMNGGFCLSTPVPIHPMFYPFPNLKEVHGTWKSLVETIGVGRENKEKMEGLELMCQLYTSWINKEESTADEIFSEPQFPKLFDMIKPRWTDKITTDKLNREIYKYFESIMMTSAAKATDNGENEKTVEEVLQEQIKSKKIYDFSLDFNTITDEQAANSMAVSCLISMMMRTSMMETFTYQLCRKPDLMNI